jgi:hypothetical protein
LPEPHGAPGASAAGWITIAIHPIGLLVTVPWSMLTGRSGQPVIVVPAATVWLATRARIAAHPPGLPGTALLAAS